MLLFFLLRYKNIISLVSVFCICLSGLICGKGNLSLDFNKGREFLVFFVSAFHHVEQGFKNVFNSYINYENIRNKNRSLEKQLIEINQYQSSLNYLKEENKRLRRLLSFSQRLHFKTVEATVISKEIDHWFSTFVIDKGYIDGISVHMPVISHNLIDTKNLLGLKLDFQYGVVGKIIQVNPKTSRLLLITSHHSHIGVILKKRGDWALLEGTRSYQYKLLLKYLDVSANVQTGDLFVTSGNNGIFPRGILVGYMHSNIKKMGNFWSADIKPVIDFSRLEYVSVILKKVHQGTTKWEPFRVESSSNVR